MAPRRGGAHQPQSVWVMKMDMPAYAYTASRRIHIKTYTPKQQGEVKAINVLGLAMHHTSALIDRWHQENVLFLYPHTHTPKKKKRAIGLFSRTKMSTAKKEEEKKIKYFETQLKAKKNYEVYLLAPQCLQFSPPASASVTKLEDFQHKLNNFQFKWVESSTWGRLPSLTCLLHIWYLPC